MIYKKKDHPKKGDIKTRSETKRVKKPKKPTIYELLCKEFPEVNKKEIDFILQLHMSEILSWSGPERLILFPDMVHKYETHFWYFNSPSLASFTFTLPITGWSY